MIRVKQLDSRGTERDGIRIEHLSGEPAECHVCGKVGQPRILVNLAHLCQHFVAFCEPCWKMFRKMLLEIGGPR